MSHYYTDNSDLKSKEIDISFDYKGQTIHFLSDNGVFSKQRIDYGSRVLLDTITIDENVQSLLDVGCGYGTLGISLKKAFPHLKKVDMVDVNLRAINLANRNIKCNNLDGIEAKESNIYENVFDTYDMIISNPPIRAGKSVVTTILSEAYQHLNNGGKLVIVIQKKQGAPSAKKKMEEVFHNVETLNKDKGYYILSSIK